MSAALFADLLGLTRAAPWGPFLPVEDALGVTFDFVDDSVALNEERLAFMVDEGDLDAIIERLRTRNLEFWADSVRTRPGEVARRYGGRSARAALNPLTKPATHR